MTNLLVLSRLCLAFLVAIGTERSSLVVHGRSLLDEVVKGTEESKTNDRNISAEINPGCESSPTCLDHLNSSYFAVIHVTGLGDEDAMHYVWSTYKVPSFLIAKTSNTSNFTINWEAFFSDNDLEPALEFSEPPEYSYGIVLTKLFDYNDDKDKGAFMSQPRTIIDMQDFEWDNSSDATLYITSNNCSAIFTTAPSKALPHGEFKIKMLAHGTDTVGEILPHLLLTPNSSQLTISLLDFVGAYNTSRYGMEVLIVSSYDTKSTRENFTMNHVKTLDDEYSPGVFRTFSVSHSRSDGTPEGYAAWKPVAYTGTDRLIAHSVDATVRGLESYNNTEDRPKSVVMRYFDSAGVPYTATKFTVSFGTPMDGFYKNTNYTEWSFVIGYGTMPEEKMSLLVILVITVGLGLPVLIMLTGCVYLGGRKVCQQKDELLLDRDDGEEE